MYLLYNRDVAPFNSALVVVSFWLFVSLFPFHTYMYNTKYHKDNMSQCLRLGLLILTLSLNAAAFSPGVSDGYFSTNTKAPARPQVAMFEDSNILLGSLEHRLTYLNNHEVKDMILSGMTPCEKKGTCQLDVDLFNKFNTEVSQGENNTERAIGAARWYNRGNTAMIERFQTASYSFWGAICTGGAAGGNFIPCIFSAVFIIGTWLVGEEVRRQNESGGSEMVYPDSSGYFNQLGSIVKRGSWTDREGNIMDLYTYPLHKRDEWEYDRDNITFNPIGFLDYNGGRIYVSKSSVMELNHGGSYPHTHGFSAHYTTSHPSEHKLGRRMNGNPEVYDFFYNHNMDIMAGSDYMGGDDAQGDLSEQSAEAWNENQDAGTTCKIAYTTGGEMFRQRTMLTKDGYWHGGELQVYQNTPCEA